MRSKAKKIYCRVSIIVAVIVFTLVLVTGLTGRPVYASPTEMPDNSGSLSVTQDQDPGDIRTDDVNGLSIIYNNENGTMSATVRIVLLLTIISLAPSILIMMTSFTRIIVVLHFLRAALGTQTTPPNQVLVGLALFLTFMIMAPVFSEVNENAIKPLDAGTITQEQAIEEALDPMRDFM